MSEAHPRAPATLQSGDVAARGPAGRESLALAQMDPEPSKPADAAAQAAWLARNAVDSLPEGGLERKLALGRPLRVKLGIDPTAPDIHLGLHGGAPEAPRVPGSGAHGRADHRRLHRPGRGSQRPLGDASDDRRRRRSTPTARRSRSRRSRSWTPGGSRCASTASGSTCRCPICSRCFARPRLPSCSSAMTSPSGSRPASRSRCWSCCTRCCRGSIRSRSTPTSSSEGPTRSSTCCSGATSSAPTASQSR